MPPEQNLMQMLATTIKEVAAKVMEKTFNDIYQADPNAVESLIDFRVFCDPKVETHTLAIPFIEKKGAALKLGALGLLNAVAGLHGLRIVGQYTDDGVKLLGFKVEVLNDGDAAKQSGHGPELREATPGPEGPREEAV